MSVTKLPIKGYKGYSVDCFGKVYSWKYGYEKELKQSEHKGYRRVALSRDNKRKIFPVHRLVALAFIGEPPETDMEINHIDGNKANNHVDNLKWVTRSENQRHSLDELGNVNGHTGYRYAKMYPNEELRNKLCEFGIPRWKHNLAELGEMLPQMMRSGKTTSNSYTCQVFSEYIGGTSKMTLEHATTEADARAAMLIYLIKNNLLDPKTLHHD